MKLHAWKIGTGVDSRRSTPSGRRVLILGALLAACLVLPRTLKAQVQDLWRIETVDNDPSSDVGRYPALAIGPDGSLNVGYYDATHNALRYAYRAKSEKRWYRMQVDSRSGTYVSLAVDAAGHPHFAYNSVFEDGLHYATWDGKTWHRQIIDTEHTNYYTGLQLDSEGHPRISYYLYHAPDHTYILHLKYAAFDGKKWTIETVDKRSETGKFNSLALDAAGNPHIAYANVGLGDLLYAAWDGSNWNFGTPDSRRLHNDYVGIGNSIALDKAGNPHIAYLDYTQNLIKYVYFDGKKWNQETVNQMVSRGEVDHVSLKLDSRGRPHIAYYDGGSGVLKYASRTADGWQTEVVDNSGNNGKFPSLCLDADDTPYIAYYALDRHALRVAHLERTAVAAIPATK